MTLDRKAKKEIEREKKGEIVQDQVKEKLMKAESIKMLKDLVKVD